MSSEEIRALVLTVAKAINAGQVSVEQLDGMTLNQMDEVSREGWDKLDETIAKGEKAGHENH